MTQQHKKTSHKESIKAKAQKTTSFINLNFVKEEYIRWMFVIFTTVIAYIVLAWIITKVYVPNIDLLKEKASEITFFPTNPEPIESLLYQLGLIFIPISLFVLYWISKKPGVDALFKKQKYFTSVSMFFTILLVGFVYYIFNTPNPFFVEGVGGNNEHDSIAATNFDFFFHNLFFQKHLILFIFLLFPIFLSVFFWFFEKKNWDENKWMQRAFAVIAWIILGCLLMVIIPLNSFDFPYSWQNKFDFNAVFYSVAQVYGGSPMLVDGMSNTYGLYPQLLNPIFQLTGLSVKSFSTTMGLLIGLCFIFQAYFLNRFTKNKLLFLLGCCSIVFFPYLLNKLLTVFDPYYAAYPIRTLTFSVLLFLTAFYLNNKNKILFIFVNIIMGTMILWNPEIGIVSFFSWLAVLFYMNFYNKENKIALMKVIKSISFSFLLVLLVFGIYALIIKGSYGKFPDFGELFKMIIIFGQLGYGTLPMTVVHPWNLLILIYIIGLTYSVTQFFQRKITSKASAIFLLSILGLGFFVYFVGRSHNWNLAAVSGIGFMLLVLLADELWLITKASKLLSIRVLFSILVFILSISFIEIFANAENIKKLPDDKKERLNQLQEENTIKENQQFINQHTSPHEKIIVLTSNKYQGLYFYKNKTRSAANPGILELALNADKEHYEQVVRDSSVKIFMEPGAFYYPAFKPLCAYLASTYQLSNSNGKMVMLEKRSYKPDFSEIMNDNQQGQIIHEIFQDNVKGFEQRKDYALGKDSIQLGNEFFVEVIFDAQAQIYQYATLLSNQVDSAGFSIFCADNQKTYYLTVGKQMLPIMVVPNQTNYIAVNINNHSVSIFVNGAQIGNYLFEKPYIESNSKFYIGNYDHLRYYLGSIQEVSIGKGLLSSEKIKEHWDLVNKNK